MQTIKWCGRLDKLWELNEMRSQDQQTFIIWNDIIRDNQELIITLQHKMEKSWLRRSNA